MSTAREEIMAESAEWLAVPGLTMVNELTDVPGSPRTAWVGAARVDGVEGVLHVVVKGRAEHLKFFAKFTSDETYRQRWGA